MKKLTGAILLAGSTGKNPDIEYLTGFRAPDAVLFLKKGNDKYIVVPELELGRAERSTNRVHVMSPRTLGLKGKRARGLGAWSLGLIRKLGLKKVTVPADFPVGIAAHLKKSGIYINIARRELVPERAVKKVSEIAKIKEAQQAAVIAMRTAIATIAQASITHDGFLKYQGKYLTSEAIIQLIDRVLFDHNCLGRNTIAACGDQAVDPHETGQGLLLAHNAILMDIFPQHLEHGYWGDLSRTVVRGTPSPELKKMYRAVRSAQAAALHKLRPGIQCASVHRAAVEEIKNRGFVTSVVDGHTEGFIHSTGHGVGLAIHEEPSISLNKYRLKKGNVITIEPGLYYPGTGGVRIEDTVIITSSGWSYLVPCEKRFEI